MRRPWRAVAAQEATGAPRAFADYQEILRQETPDIVSVGPRWTDCLQEMELACLEAGAHMSCEKHPDSKPHRSYFPAMRTLMPSVAPFRGV